MWFHILKWVGIVALILLGFYVSLWLIVLVMAGSLFMTILSSIGEALGWDKKNDEEGGK